MAKKNHVCHVCNKSYSRAEHLQRHADSHQNVKPWRCHFCSKYFARRDVLNRHFKSCVPAAKGARAQGGRVNRACQNCKERKVKCSGGQPCSLCAKLPVECVYTLHGEQPYVRRQSVTTPSAAAPSTATSSTPAAVDDNSDQLGQQLLPSSVPAPYSTTNGQSASVDHSRYPTTGTMSNESSNMILDHANQAKIQSFSSVADDRMNDKPGWNSGTSSNLGDWLFLDTYQGPQDPSYLPQTQVANVERPINGLPKQVGSRFPETRPDAMVSNPPPSFPVPVPDPTQIHPLEHHRMRIFQYLQDLDGIKPQHTTWLTNSHMSELLKVYFERHNQHTPIIHIPRWNVATCETPLIFSLMLIALSCVPDAFMSLGDPGVLVKAAYDFTEQNSTRPLTLENIQALLFLAIADKLILDNGHTHSQMDLSRIVSLAREAKLFEESANLSIEGKPQMPWQDWAYLESSRRTGFVLYAFDALISCLEERRPYITSAEMNLRMPSPENMFLAKTADEWGRIRRPTAAMGSLPYSVILSLLLSDLSLQVDLPPSLLGGFVVLHGIMAYMLETRTNYHHGLHNYTASAREVVHALGKKRYQAVQGALQVWCKSWFATLENPLCAASPHGLYKDRSMVYWYLTGISSLCESERPSSKSQIFEVNGLSFKALLQRLVVAYDKGQLSSCDGDFVAARKLVVKSTANPESTRIPIGSLLYKEPDAGQK